MNNIIPFKKCDKGIFKFTNSYSTSTILETNADTIKDYLINTKNIQINFLPEEKAKVLLTTLEKGKAKYIENMSDCRSIYIKNILQSTHNDKSLRCILKKISFKENFFTLDKNYGRVFFVKNIRLENVQPIRKLLNSNITITLHIRRIDAELILNAYEKNEFTIAEEFKQTFPKVKEQLEKSIEENKPLFLFDIEILLLTDKTTFESETKELIFNSKKLGYEIETLYYQQKEGLNNILPYGVNFLQIENTISRDSILKIGGWK